MRSGDVKIGLSVDPTRRCQQISRSYDVGTLYVAGVCWFNSKDIALLHERSFHRMYRTRQSTERGGREWFSLSLNEVEDFIGAMKTYEVRRHQERGRYRNNGVGRKEGITL
jgi:hypothetical protein